MKPKRSIMENSVFNGHQRNPSPKNMDYSSPYYHKNLFTKNAYPFIQEFKALPDQNPAAPENEFKKRQTLDPEIPKNLTRISVKLNYQFTEKSVIVVSNMPANSEISKDEFVCFLRLMKTVNVGRRPLFEDIDIPDLLIEIFLRILIKKRFIIKDFKNLPWSPDTVDQLMSTPIAKKKEESLKYVIRETFAILNDKYRSIHYYYWNSVNPKSSLKIERERNYYVGFTRFYFGELIDENKKKGIRDQINNYTLPNKKNGNLKSSNKSITPRFLKRLFQSKKFYADFMKILDSPFNGFYKKCLRNVLYSDAESKISSWLSIYDEFKGYKSLARALKKKVSGSKAKLPWFRVEIESAIGIVKFHIMNIQATRFKSLYV